MTDFAPGDVFVAGGHGYVERIDATGIPATPHHIHVLDSLGNELLAAGLAISKGKLFIAKADPAFATDNNPMDVVPLPDESAVLVAVARLVDTLELWKLDYTTGAVMTTYTGLDVDTGWTHETPVKIDVECGGSVVWYTDRGRTIFKYDMSAAAGAGANVTPFDVLDVSSPYIYADFAILPPGVIVNKTATGHGPRNALALAPGGTFWSDEINPPGSYHVFKRLASDGTDVLNHVVSLNPADANDEVWALACYFDPCGARRRVAYSWIGT